MVEQSGLMDDEIVWQYRFKALQSRLIFFEERLVGLEKQVNKLMVGVVGDQHPVGTHQTNLKKVEE